MQTQLRQAQLVLTRRVQAAAQALVVSRQVETQQVLALEAALLAAVAAAAVRQVRALLVFVRQASLREALPQQIDRHRAPPRRC